MRFVPVALAILFAAPLAHAEVEWPAREVIREQGPSPYWFRERKPIVGVGLRPSLKVVGRLGDVGDLHRFASGVDLHAVGRIGIGRGRTVGLWPEIGYVQTGTDGRYASLGLGIASQPPPLYTTFSSGLAFGLVPHLLVGRRSDQLARGLRTSALAEIYLDDGNAWGLELAHQMIVTADRVTHELTFGISLTWLAQQWK